MHTPIIHRRRLLKAGAALSTLAIAPSPLRAQAKVAPPNVIKAGTLVMSINPTLPTSLPSTASATSMAISASCSP